MTPEQERYLEQQVQREITRRHFMRWAGRAGIGGFTAMALGGGLLAACGGNDDDGDSGQAATGGNSSTTAASGTTTSGGGGGGGNGQEIKIGVIAPFTGPFAFVGEVVRASIGAGLGYLNAEQGGQFRGYKPVIVEKDAPLAPSDGQRAYGELAADKDVVGIVWGGSPGLAESLNQIAQDGIPNVSAFTDLQGFEPLTKLNLNSAQATGLPVFQKAMPDPLAFDVMLDYAKNDRGYNSAALVYEPTFFPTAKTHFENFARQHGLESRGVETYDITQGRPDYAGPLQRIAGRGTQSIFLWGLADNTAALAVEIDKLGGRYVDTPTARAEKFKPHVMGAPGGTGDAAFRRLAGEAAARGTITAWYLGGVVGLPSMPIRDWITKYQKNYNNGVIKGGEDGPVDGVMAIVNAVAEAGSTDRKAVNEVLESGLETKFASPIGFSWDKERHVSLTRDDIILVSLQYPPEPFNLGDEWQSVFQPGYQGPTHLVDFTAEANRRKHPDVMKEVFDTRYGTSCSTQFQGGDQAKIDACKTIN